MAKTRSAGDLDQRVAFDKRASVADTASDGNTLGDWVEQCRVAAGFIHLRGGESVLANRLQGRHVQVIFVLSSSETRQATADWRIRNVRTGATFNIRDVTPSTDRLWLDFLCDTGGADG